jgi:Cu(I)/Ag(I) efflux system membrane protein CusA/SilA
MTWEDLVREMDARLRIPGIPNIFWMPIQTRTGILATGIRSRLGITVFGADLATLELLVYPALFAIWKRRSLP